MISPSTLLVSFALRERVFALRLSLVERIIPAVQITPLPKAPEIVLGIINVRGRVVPVVNLCRRFRIPEQEVRLSDHILVARTAHRPVALLVDQVLGVVDCPTEAIAMTESILPRLEYVEGVVKSPDGLLIIHDINTFLSLEEEGALGSALGESAVPCDDQPESILG